MLLLLLGYFLNFIMYSVSVYLALLLMENIGKRRPGMWRGRITLAGLWAAGTIMLQLMVQVTLLVYTDIFH